MSLAHVPVPELLPFEFSGGSTRHLTHKMARALITVARAVARGEVDARTVELARRLADEIKRRQRAATAPYFAARWGKRAARYGGGR